MEDSLIEKDPDDPVTKALHSGPFSMRQLASESGLSYDVLRSWRTGRRNPNPEGVRKLANGLSARADRLLELAQELRRLS